MLIVSSKMAREDITVGEGKQMDSGKPDLGCAWYAARLNKEEKGVCKWTQDPVSYCTMASHLSS